MSSLSNFSAGAIVLYVMLYLSNYANQINPYLNI